MPEPGSGGDCCSRGCLPRMSRGLLPKAVREFPGMLTADFADGADAEEAADGFAAFFFESYRCAWGIFLAIPRYDRQGPRNSPIRRADVVWLQPGADGFNATRRRCRERGVRCGRGNSSRDKAARRGR